MEPKWHVKWDSLIIKASFKCKSGCAEAYGMGLILTLGMLTLTTKAFPFRRSENRFSTLRSALHTPRFSLHDSISSYWACTGVRADVACSSCLPPRSPSSGCLECGRKSTGALLPWADCPVHPPGDSSQCWLLCCGTPWYLPTAWRTKHREGKCHLPHKVV